MAEQDSCKEGDYEIVLRRKPKKRYLAVMHKGLDTDALNSISRRCKELFGQMTLEKASMRLMRSHTDVIVFRCRLGQIHPILVSIALADPPMIAIDMSGSIARLKIRIDV